MFNGREEDFTQDDTADMGASHSTPFLIPSAASV